jgi:hypothetical protein
MVEQITLSSSVELSSLWEEVSEGTFVAKLDQDRKMSLKGTELCVFHTSTLTAGEITELNAIVTAHDYDHNIFIKENLVKREINREAGYKFWDDYSNEISYNIGTAAYTVTVGKSIYNSAEPITHHLTRGSWLSAHTDSLLLTVTTDFTQALKDDLSLQLKTYVNANYPVFLHIP